MMNQPSSKLKDEIEAAKAFLHLAKNDPHSCQAGNSTASLKSSPPEETKAFAVKLAPSGIEAGLASQAPSQALASKQPSDRRGAGAPQTSSTASASSIDFDLYSPSHVTSGEFSRNKSSPRADETHVDSSTNRPKSNNTKEKSGKARDPNMPKRPFHSYSIFFAVEREKILNAVPENGIQGEDKEARIDGIISCLESLTPEEEGKLEKRAATRILKEQCEPVGEKKKKPRKHRKSHGKVGFVEMNAVISRRWKSLQEAKKNFFRDLGIMDSMRFTHAIDAYHIKKKREARK
uniref:HMG box domain-containing protein n=1 Tax=Odontella aurita TaxID=265563 RepID=A0A7S4JTM9_9STRA|mmetsp:Transcript_53780/g.160969  ORF Transcript_53780/g.160969 Transcript_53780/m.160969 type:complete len:291 (+) Transcript_53780:52-924(+)